MEKAAESQIFSSLGFFNPWLLCAAVLVPSLFFICFLIYGFSAYLFAITVLFLSTVFIIKLSKKKVVTVSVKNPGQDGSPSETVPDNVGEETIKAEVEIGTQCSAAKQSEVCEYQVELTDHFPSDSESSDDFLATESFELTWKCSNYVGQGITISESSDDDEEDGDDLIEISLPMNNSSHVVEEQKHKLQPNLPDYLSESIYRQEGLMELLAEINEVNDEESLIEIDLSMDSIKCSRFEI